MFCVTVRSDIAPLLIAVEPLTPQTPVAAVGELFLREDYSRMLSLPVVDNGSVVGGVSRSQLINIFLRPFGREIYGPRKISNVMNTQPLTVRVDQPLEAAAQFVVDRLPTPLTEDFIIVDGDDRYLGMGVVLDLLREMERRVALSNQKLSETNQRLKQSQAQLVQSEKMASLGQMVAGIAHEINTPLGYVRNNVEMMNSVFGQLGKALADYEGLMELMTADAPDEQAVNAQIERVISTRTELGGGTTLLDDTAALLKDTVFGVDQIKDLVVNLRNFSRLDQARVAEVSLNDCLDQTLMIARNVTKDKVEIIKRYGSLPPIRCSPSQINQVLLNIISNAAQAIEHDHGRLLLKTETVPGWALISIQDNGKGIPPENLKKIFDPFFTTKSIGHGTGLGLSISFQIIQAHGGEIKVVSEVGRGTKFVIRIPLEPVPIVEPLQQTVAA